jgi:hypothetical protein
LGFDVARDRVIGRDYPVDRAEVVEVDVQPVEVALNTIVAGSLGSRSARRSTASRAKGFPYSPPTTYSVAADSRAGPARASG